MHTQLSIGATGLIFDGNLRPDFFYKMIYMIFFRFRVKGTEKNALKMSFSELFFCVISRTNSRTNKVNQQSVLNH